MAVHSAAKLAAMSGWWAAKKVDSMVGRMEVLWGVRLAELSVV